MTTQTDTDEALVEQARRGSSSAFAELVALYQNRAYATAIGVLSDFDAAQEAFLCAYSDLAKLKEPSRFGAWVSGIARFTAHKALRDRGKAQRSVEAIAAKSRSSNTPRPSARPKRPSGATSSTAP